MSLFGTGYPQFILKEQNALGFYTNTVETVTCPRPQFRDPQYELIIKEVKNNKGDILYRKKYFQFVDTIKFVNLTTAQMNSLHRVANWTGHAFYVPSSTNTIRKFDVVIDKFRPFRVNNINSLDGLEIHVRDRNTTASVKTLDNLLLAKMNTLVGWNTVLNGNFEVLGGDLFSGWTNIEPGSTSVNNEVVNQYEGAQCVRFDSDGPDAASIYQVVNVTAGMNGTFKYFTRGDGSNQGKIQIYDITNAADIIAEQDAGNVGTVWQGITHSFAVPAGCATVGVTIKGSIVTASNVYFDMVELRIH